MEWLEVLELIAVGENRKTEFKNSLDMRDVGKAVCAFANTEGGTVILGVSDTGNIVGVSAEPKSVQERLTSLLQSGCSSPVSAAIGRHKDPRGWVYWIDVPRVRGFEPLRSHGRIYVRRESSSVEPSAPELQELYNVFGFVLTEEQVIRAATVEGINVDEFYAYLRKQEIDVDQEPQPKAMDDLWNRGVVDQDGGTFRPTLFGLMAFGKRPQAYPHTKDFLIRCAAYNGSDQAAGVLLVGDGAGRLDEQVRRAIDWVKSLGRTEVYNGIVREDRSLVPETALREALVNAVIHRDYAQIGSPVQLEVFNDRVVVTSPGSLPNHMTVESVRAGGRPRARNQAMAHAMDVAGLMERRGRGWPTMRRAMQEFNGSEPELINDVSKFVIVTFRLQVDSIAAGLRVELSSQRRTA